MQNSGTCTRLARLRVNNVEAPQMLEDKQPLFSWQMITDRQGAAQQAYRICVKKGEECVWDSGRVESAESLSIEYPQDAAELQAQTAYSWQLSVWDERGEEVNAFSSFCTGLMGGNLAAWHGAQWIGPDRINLAAEVLPVYRIAFTMQVKEGGSKAGVIFGANDPRLTASIHNNYLIAGENYFAYKLDVSTIPAVIEICRKGYTKGESEEVIVESLQVPTQAIHEGNRFGKHVFEIVISGSQMEVMTVDGYEIETPEEYAKILAEPLNPNIPRTHVILNPLKVVTDMPVFPRLNEIGFYTAEDTQAVFTDYCVRHYNGEHAVIFGEKTGASYCIFEAEEKLTVCGNEIEAAAGCFCYANPSFGAIPMLRREFEVKEGLTSAKVYAAAQGIYELSLNGAKVGEEYLANGDMDFRHRIVYNVYDVTAQLRQGANAIGATLAAGWFNDAMSYSVKVHNFYGDKQAFLGLMVLTYADGSVEYVVTDDNWQYYGEGPVRYAGNFNGESYDANCEKAICGWDLPDFAAEGWQAASLMGNLVCGMEPQIVAKSDTGIVKIGEIGAKYHSTQTRGEDQDRVYIYDMGINMVGLPEITLPAGRKGQQITVRYAEMLYPNLELDNPYYYGELGGLILTENLRGALVTDRYTMKGEGVEVIRPRFTFHGYRYVEIAGTDGPIPEENIRGILLSSVKQTTRYESSCPLTNQLYENIVRSTLENHISIPTDCPQRDERLGWAGDANVFSETATYVADMSAFYSYYNELQRDAQGADGTYNLYAPSLAPIGHAFALGYAWNAAGVMIPFECWLQYGDRKELEDNYPAFRKHVLGMMERKEADCEYLSSNISFVADHLSVETSDTSLMANAQFYRVVKRVAEAARILGEEADAVSFEAYAEGLRKEWNEKFVGADHRTCNLQGEKQDTQATYAMALVCDVFSEENKGYAAQYLAEACERAGYTMTTGFMGTGPLLPALTRGGQADTAYRLFEQTAYPSWLYPVLNGATTVWERWNSYTIQNGFGGNNWMNSFNHYSLGAVASWMIEYQAGIQRGDEAGFKHFVLQPTPGGHFTHVNASYDSVMGTIESGWTAEDGVMKSYHAAVPANTSATLYLPVDEAAVWKFTAESVEYKGMVQHNGRNCAVYELTAGEYDFIGA